MTDLTSDTDAVSLGWISIKDRLPTINTDVIVYIAGAKKVFGNTNFDHSKYKNYEPQVTVMRLFKSNAANKDTQKGLYWNFEHKGNAISHRNDRMESNLITHWQPLPVAPN